MLLALIWTVLLDEGSGTVAKCCAPSEVFLASFSACGETQPGNIWHPSVAYKVEDGQLVALASLEVARLAISANFLEEYSNHRVANCSDVYMLEPSEKWKLVEGGLLEHQGYGLTTGYCVDHELHPDGKVDTLVLRCLEGNTTGVKEECLNTQSSHLLVIFTVLGYIGT